MRTRPPSSSPAVRRAIAEAVEPRLLFAAYHFSAAGNDNAGDGSAANPWQTIAKANTLDLNPGDQVLFRGGDTFGGTVELTAQDAGTAASPVTVGSYGSGRATISAGTAKGVSVYNAGGVTVRDLVVVGAGRANGNLESGVELYTDAPGNARHAALRADNLDVSGFGSSGITVLAYPTDGSKSGFDDVRITDSAAHANADSGISAYGFFSASSTAYAHSNLYIADCRAYDNPGVPDKGTNSGSGIVISDVDGATVERCVAYANGRSNNFNGGGPVGVWAYDANNVTIQYNESYANRTGSVADGGGFDLDGGVTNSVLQYNYSHDNDGAGYLLYQYAGARAFDNNVVRYNVSQDDGRRNGYGGIYTGGGVANSDVYHNTVFVSPAPSGSPTAVGIESGTTNVRFRNNALVATGGLRLVRLYGGASNIAFQGNAYWAGGGGAFAVEWAGTTYTSLAAWRSGTGQERNGSADVGLFADPRFRDAGNGPTVNDPRRLSTLTAYKLAADSPLRDAGLDLAAGPFNLPVGPRDFYGAASRQGAAHDAGAHEAAPAPWLDEDVGGVGLGGNASVAPDGTWTVRGSGADIWDNADEFHFAYRPLPADGTVTARVASVGDTDAWAKAGVMVRESLAAGSRHAFAALSRSNGVLFHDRTSTGGSTGYANAGVGSQSSYWVRLVRSGATVTGYRSADGSNWTGIGSTTLGTGTYYVGLAVTSHNDAAVNTSTFTNVAVSTAAQSGPQGPAGYSYVANEGQGATFNTPVDLAYGANGSFNYRYNFTGTVTFDNATFLDPIPGVAKAGFSRPAQVAAPVGRRIALRADVSGKVTQTDPGQPAGGSLSASSTDSNDAAERFDVVDAGGGYVALRSVGTGRYVTVDDNRGEKYLRADWATAVQSWERFQWVDAGNGRFGLKSDVTGLFVTADQNANGRLRAGWASTVQSWERFTFEDLGPAAA